MYFNVNCLHLSRYFLKMLRRQIIKRRISKKQIRRKLKIESCVWIVCACLAGLSKYKCFAGFFTICTIYKTWKYSWKSVTFATLLKLILLHGCFLRFLICTTGTKSREASHISVLTSSSPVKCFIFWTKNKWRKVFLFKPNMFLVNLVIVLFLYLFFCPCLEKELFPRGEIPFNISNKNQRITSIDFVLTINQKRLEQSNLLKAKRT